MSIFSEIDWWGILKMVIVVYVAVFAVGFFMDYTYQSSPNFQQGTKSLIQIAILLTIYNTFLVNKMRDDDDE